MNQIGCGVSKFEENYINRFKRTDDYNQGIFFYIKDIKTNEIWSATDDNNCEQFTVQFMPDRNQFEKTEEEIKTKFIKACMKGLSVFSYTPSLIQFIYGQKNNDRPNKGSSSTGLRSLQDKYGW